MHSADIYQATVKFEKVQFDQNERKRIEAEEKVAAEHQAMV